MRKFKQSKLNKIIALFLTLIFCAFAFCGCDIIKPVNPDTPPSTPPISGEGGGNDNPTPENPTPETPTPEPETPTPEPEPEPDNSIALTFNYGASEPIVLKTTLPFITQDDLPVVQDSTILGWTTTPSHRYRMVNFPFVVNGPTSFYAVRQSDFDNYFPIININTNGQAVSNTDAYTAMTITMSNTLPEYEFTNISAGIRIRGNTTRNPDKKPYRIKFNTSRSILGQPKHKSWVLLADYLDASLVRNYSAHYLARLMTDTTMEYVSCSFHVKVYLNGEYRGMYLLCDQVEVQESTRIDIEEPITPDQVEVPFLIEKIQNTNRINQETAAGENVFQDSRGLASYVIKYPEKEVITQAQIDYIVNTFNTADDALRRQRTDEVRQLVDVQSIYDWTMINELIFNYDGFQLSQFISKSRTGKIKVSTVWDFDFSLIPTWPGTRTGNGKSEEIVTTTRYDGTDSSVEDLTQRNYYTDDDNANTGHEAIRCWSHYVWRNPTFQAEYKFRWTSYVSYLAQQTIDELKAYRIAIDKAGEENCDMWYEGTRKVRKDTVKNFSTSSSAFYKPPSGKTSLFDDQYDYVINFLTKRKAYLDNRYAI